MLIYVNQFNLVGENRDEMAFRSIAGWLKKVTKRHFTIDELKSGSEFVAENMMVRTYNAVQFEPALYSVLLTHPDSKVRGRQWVTEIGIKSEQHYSTVSILLETIDVSTQVKDIPSTTRPGLVGFLQKNARLDKDTIGQSVRRFKNYSDDYKALSAEIERAERTYPIVLVSNGENNKALINPIKLQEQLIGLAQVVCTNDEIDSWEMERILSRSYSAWGGAINIIFPSKGRSFCYSNLLLSNQIQTWLEEGTNVNHQILSIITHTTNGYNKKKHFKPTDVRAKRQKDQRVYLKQKFEQLADNNEYKSLAEEAFEQLEEQGFVIEKLKEEHQQQIYELEEMYLDLQEKLDNEEKEKNKLSYRIEDLNFRLNESGFQTQSNDILSPQDIIDAICINLTPEICLKLTQQLYPNRAIVLESAYVSARDSVRFKNSPKLLNYLSKLVTDYLDTVQDGGDSKAKTIFGKAFSANESDTVEKNPKLAKLRVFKYRNSEIAMFKHIRIGTSRNPEETIRIHFHVDLERNAIVIGYCGEHLPISST